MNWIVGGAITCLVLVLGIALYGIFDTTRELWRIRRKHHSGEGK